MPGPTFPTPTWPSAESLPSSSPLRQIYPEDSYANGSYFPSPYGRVRYAIIGPEDGTKIVLIHGISTPSIVFKHVANTLISKGYRVLVYDLYGRGYSEAPKLPQEPNIYALQLALLLQYILWENVNVVGLSMGGGIAAAFASLFPHLVKEGVVFLASAGLLELPVDQNGEYILPTPEKAAVTLNAPVAYQLRKLQMELLPGYATVLVSSMKHGPITNMHWAFEMLGRSDKRVLIIHGTADEIVPHSEAAKIKSLIPHAEVVDIDGGSHYLVAQDGVWPDVAEHIAKFFA